MSLIVAAILGGSVLQAIGDNMSKAEERKFSKKEAEKNRLFQAEESGKDRKLNAIGMLSQREQALNAQKFSAEESAASRSLQMQNMDFGRGQFMAQAPQRTANVLSTLMPYREGEDKRRFNKTAIKHIGKS